MGTKLSELPKDLQEQVRHKMDAEDAEPVEAGQGAATSVPHDSSMNKTEQAYAEHLELMKIDEQIISYKREPFNIRLAKGTFYKPDFAVLTADHEIEIHEVKGYWRDDALVKIKVAADCLPWFRFVAAKKDGNRWSKRYFEPFKQQNEG